MKRKKNELRHHQRIVQKNDNSSKQNKYEENKQQKDVQYSPESRNRYFRYQSDSARYLEFCNLIVVAVVAVVVGSGYQSHNQCMKAQFQC